MMTSLKNAVCGALLALSLTSGLAVPALAKPSSSQSEQIPNFVQTAHIIKDALQNQQYAKITPYIHPKKGVRFSMYAYVNVKKDKVFSRRDFGHYLKQSKIKFTWGDKDGIGEPLITPLPSYLSDWVVRDNLSAPSKVGVNEFYGTGNSLNNLREVYPTQDFVEFYYAGNKQYDCMDWRCLRLVFETYQGRPYLVAIITDEWTI